MTQPEVWYAIPSASPENCRKTLPVWREMGYKIAILQNWEKADIPADLVVWSDRYDGWAGSINRLCTEIVPKSAKIIVSGGDDMLPDPNMTAGEIAEQFAQRFPDGFGVMQPHGDAWSEARHYCGSPWIGRTFADTMYMGRGPMWGGYRHNWADVELYWVARSMGVLWTRDDLAQHHDNFRRRDEDKPAYWVKNVQENDAKDVQLYLARSWLQFPGHEPLRDVGHTFDPKVLEQDTRRLAEDHWLNLYAPHRAQQNWENTTKAAMERLARQGVRRVALYGAGTHTKALSNLLADPPVEVVCVVDDSPKNIGRKMWGFPIVNKRDAIQMGVQAVILSANSVEDKLWILSEPFRAAGIPVVRLYTADTNAGARATVPA